MAPAVLPPCPGAAGELSQERELIWPQLIPVVKADAYGHGHEHVVRALLDEGATLFASGCVREAVALRSALEKEEAGGHAQPCIIALLGIMDTGDVQLAAARGIVPVIHCFEQISLLEQADSPLAVALK